MDLSLAKKQVIIQNLLLTYYYAPAAKKKQTLLFLHGWRSNSTLWFSVTNPLVALGHGVICLDLPGFGESQTPSGPWTHSDYCTLVSGFIHKLKLPLLTLVGHSFGGSLGIKLAVQSPQLFNKLILVNSSGIRKKTVGRLVKQIAAKILKPLFLLPFMRGMKTKIYQLIRADDYLATPELQQTYINILNEDLTPLISQINLPTLIIWGEHDQETPVAFANTMHDLIPSSQLRVFTDTSHFSFLDKPKEFVDAVEKFINEDVH